jgi:hypothetical protein
MEFLKAVGGEARSWRGAKTAFQSRVDTLPLQGGSLMNDPLRNGGYAVYRGIITIVLFIVLSGTPAFAIPLEMTIENTEEGGLTFVTGKTNLPDGTKLGVTLTKIGYSAQDYNIIVKDGRFKSIGFSYRGYPMSGRFELSLMSSFNEAWQKPDLLKKLSEYESPYIRNGRLKIVRNLSFRTSKGEKPMDLAAQKAELNLFKKHLETLREMGAELDKAGKDPNLFSTSSPGWNQRLKKQREAFLKDFGKNVKDYKGCCVNAYLEISDAQVKLAALWQKYDEFFSGKGEIDLATGKMKQPYEETELEGMMERAENSIAECSP